MNTKIDKTDQEDLKYLLKIHDQIFPKDLTEAENFEAVLRTDYLENYQIFHVTEFNVNSNEKEIDKYINERFQTLLSTYYSSNIPVATIFSSNNGNISVYLGLEIKKGKNEINSTEYRNILTGILPCKLKDHNDKISQFTEGTNYGGILTGAPLMFEKKNKEKQSFKITSVLRSLKNSKYTLVLKSTPIPKIEIENYKNSLFYYKNNLHPLIKRSVNQSKSKTVNENPDILDTFYTKLFGSKGLGDFKKSTSSQNSKAINSEEINSEALKFSEGIDLLIERLSKGLNNGFWESEISFVTDSKESSEILVSTFHGELANDGDITTPYFKKLIINKTEPYGLFFPTDDNLGLFPKSWGSYLTSKELAFIGSFPKESVPGFEVKKIPNLALTDEKYGLAHNYIGNITENGIESRNNTFSLSNETINKHVFITGITGSGKSTTTKQLLKNTFRKNNIPFLVIESAKRDYRQLLVDPVFNDKLRIFTIGDTNINPIKINPFYVQKGVKLSSHIDFLKAIFNASFSLYGPMPAILEKCLNNIYQNLGWDLLSGAHYSHINNDDHKFIHDSFYVDKNHYYYFPTLNTLKDEIERYINENLDYKGEYKENIKTALLVRIDSLTTGAKGLMFNTYDFHSIENLLKHPTIFEMEDLVDDDDKAFFVGLLITLISEYRQKENPVINPGNLKSGLQHILVIEEAHRLLKNISSEKSSELMGNPKGKAVELFGNVLAEMRSMGQGVIIAEQIPSKLAPEVIKNSNTKIIHRLVAKDDQSLLAGSLSISDEEALYLNRLKTGHALCHKEGMEKPVEVKFFRDYIEAAIDNKDVKERMEKFALPSLHSNRAYQLQSLLQDDGIRLITKFLNSLGISGEDYLDELLGEFQKELNILINQKVNFNFFDNKDLTDYTILQIIEVFRDGIFNFKGLIPFNINDLLRNLFNSKNEISYNELMTELINYNSELFEKICYQNLEKMINTYFQQNYDVKPSAENIVFAINDFLLIEDLASEKYILNKLKNSVWNPSPQSPQQPLSTQPPKSLKGRLKKLLKIA